MIRSVLKFIQGSETQTPYKSYCRRLGNIGWKRHLETLLRNITWKFYLEIWLWNMFGSMFGNMFWKHVLETSLGNISREYNSGNKVWNWNLETKLESIIWKYHYWLEKNNIHLETYLINFQNSHIVGYRISKFEFMSRNSFLCFQVK